MSTFNTSAVISLIASKAQGYRSMAEGFARSRFQLASIEYGQNEDEMLALEKIAAGIKCNIEQTATGVSLNIDFDDKDQGNYLEIIEHGMPAPVTGGAGGFVHNPDGSTETSKVPPELWGKPIPEFAKTGSDVLGEVKTMLSDLFFEEVRHVVAASNYEIAAQAKDYVLKELKSVL